MKVDFWQVSRDDIAEVIAKIAPRVIDEGERLLVVSKDAAQRDAISKALWKSGPETFLANGEAAAAGAELHPILFSEDRDPANGASHVIYADGEWRGGDGFKRAFLLFDEDAVEDARGTWRSLDGTEGLERSFFRKDGGKWVKIA